jgi:hypothetical protein
MKTAVEWFYEQINGMFYIHEDIYKQAKEMEKEQIMDAYENGVKETNSRCEYEDAEQYYNEQYGK